MCGPLVFACEPGPVVGGYGDRIVGLVAVRVLAKALGREFGVLWTRDDLKPYFEYSGVDTGVDLGMRRVRMIDQPQVLRDHLRRAPRPLPGPGGMSISVNAEIAQFLFQNPRFGGEGAGEERRDKYLAAMRWGYRTLYSEVLKPTAQVKARMQEVVGDECGLVGIQVRAGDCFMATGFAGDAATRYMDGEEGVRVALVGVRDRMVSLGLIGPAAEVDRRVFVTGDHPRVVALAREVFGGGGNEDGGMVVLGDDEPAQHLDRRLGEGLDQTKLYCDALILAQRCSVLFISENSNYGRVAALAGGGTGGAADAGSVYTLDGRRLGELELLSKDEMVFA
jgi:hypothetical protein